MGTQLFYELPNFGGGGAGCGQCPGRDWLRLLVDAHFRP